MEFDYKKQAQEYYSKAPVIILGSGASIEYGLPDMEKLAQAIKSNIQSISIPDKEKNNWGSFCDLLDTGNGLEQALHEVDLSPAVTTHIIKETWQLVNEQDEKIYRKSISNRKLFPLGRLLSHMFQSSLQYVDIITTNYDCLAEYACDQENLHHYSGFSHGYTRRVLPIKCVNSNRIVNIWKVHGSIDWFCSPDGETIGIPKSHLLEDNYQPQIVTPGNQKYKKTHEEPYRSIITNADKSMSDARAYLCFGFGFNDAHIQPKLLRKCQRENTPIIVVTHTLTDKAKNLLFENNIANYLAIEKYSNEDKSRIYSSQIDDAINVDNNYWNLNGFLQLIM